MTSRPRSTSRPAFCGERDAFGQRLDEPRDADLVEHLRELAAARAAHQRHRASVMGEHGLGAREGFGIAADHDRELAVLGPGLAARNRRVEESDAPGRRRRVDLARDLRGRGRMVDEDRAGSHRGERAVRRRRRRCARRRRCRRTSAPGRRRPPPPRASARSCRDAARASARPSPPCGCRRSRGDRPARDVRPSDSPSRRGREMPHSGCSSRSCLHRLKDQSGVASSALRAAAAAARTRAGAVPPGWSRLATEPSSVNTA